MEYAYPSTYLDVLLTHYFSKLSFETVVLKGLAADGGLFLPQQIPSVADWVWSPTPSFT